MHQNESSLSEGELAGQADRLDFAAGSPNISAIVTGRLFYFVWKMIPISSKIHDPGNPDCGASQKRGVAQSQAALCRRKVLLNTY